MFLEPDTNETNRLKMKILPTGIDDADQIARVVSEANKDVAELFDLTIQNAPKHPSFCTVEWILADIERGQRYFVARSQETIQACVAFEQADADTAYLNRLAVLPACRRRGIGSALVNHILEHSKAKGIRTVSIGIIAEHDQLGKWYRRLGFVDAGTRRFEHLPFNVRYMHYHL